MLAIKLYEHNMTAYKSALELMELTGKAAVIHPTGTGKSFIGFKLAEDNPDKRILWLTPSEYIVKTQLENLKKEVGAEPGDITFITYARLMLMSHEELSELQPDIIITDELHRLGAEKWFDGFDRLCRVYPNAKLLGLSATHIRYLDNRRDMADELFDGNIASEITLGEAIARGILPAPKYVIAVYEYQKELEKYSRRVAKTRSKAVRDTGEKYLEALRRTLDNADGPDEIFRKHIADRHGKYIVFCANKEHMQTMADNAPEWFSKVDNHPAIYHAYSDNPEASKEFAAFKEDNSEHLKLLFCIDMLNEGVHVEDISGVILLRPTVSPIIYKQQIGRALAAGTKKTPVIFDIVLNFENLYSISDVKEEMSEAVRYYESSGEEYEIVNESFTIIDEVRECRRLFDELEKTLSASWDCMYRAAKEYYREYGNLLPPQSYTNDDGYRIGNWIVSQRIAYSNNGLSESRIKRLEQIGMDWRNANERQWEHGFEKAKRYADEYGSIASVKKSYPDVMLWVNRQRAKYRKDTLTAEQFRRLSEIGMVWEPEDRWDIRYAEAKKYFEEYGNLDIPANYVTESGVRLGQWYRGIRRRYIENTLDESRRAQLEEIGIDAASVKIRTWMGYYKEAESYYKKNGNLKISNTYVTDSGMNLGVWISGQRYMYSRNKLHKNQITLLEQIGMIWQGYNDLWDTGYKYVMRYYEAYGDINVQSGYVTEDGYALGNWVASQRNRYRAGKLSEARIAKLNSLGMVWDVFKAAWELGFRHLMAYREQYGDVNINSSYVCEDGFKLGAWILNQKNKYKTGKLDIEYISALESKGIVWSKKRDVWRSGLLHLEEYAKRYGSVTVPQSYIAEDGFKLGGWVTEQRKCYKKGNMTIERIKALESIGFVWDQHKAQWDEKYDYARSYYEKNGNMAVPKTYVTEKGLRLNSWVNEQRKAYKKGKLNHEQLMLLGKIGIIQNADIGSAALA